MKLKETVETASFTRVKTLTTHIYTFQECNYYDRSKGNHVIDLDYIR